jgi:hypothetical protein
VKTAVRLKPGREPGRVVPVLVATARITPTTAAGGSPLPAGQWEVRAVANVGGFSSGRRLRRRNGRTLILTSFPPGRIVRGTKPPAPPQRRSGWLRRLRAGGDAAVRG